MYLLAHFERNQEKNMVQLRLFLKDEHHNVVIYKDIEMTVVPDIGQKVYIGDDFFEVVDVRYRAGGYPLDPEHHMPEISVMCAGQGKEFNFLPIDAMRIAYQEYKWMVEERDDFVSEEERERIKKLLEG